ncbi:MAG TPA: lysylphosphatidylglycerol synthase transmembrane domain-containing protein [Dehalococcoidia bacterium]|nr:lysylphosphatidylglycerol synthase transmembrane domain-containing protein [Dehalococcoidia bacterium]
MLRSVRFWLGLAISAAFIGLLFWRTPTGDIVRALKGANYWWFLPALALYLASIWVRSFRYRFLVRDLAELSANQLFPVLCIAFMANNLLPARAGELMRVYVLGERYGLKKVSALGTVIVERLFDGLTLLLFFLVTVALLGSNGTLRGLAAVSVAVFLVALAIFGLILRWPQRAEALAHRVVALLPHPLQPLGRELSTSLLSGMVALRNPAALIVTVVTSPLAWGMESGVFWMVGQSFGLHLNLGWFMMAMAAGNLALTAPSTQGGIGPFEFFARQVIVIAGAGEGVATAYALVAHAMIIVPVTVLGLLFLPIYHLRLGEAPAQTAATEDVEEGDAPDPPRSRAVAER